MPDHVHICVSIPPKYSVSYVVGYIKGKSAISIARRFAGKNEELHWGEFLGKRLFCYHGWS